MKNRSKPVRIAQRWTHLLVGWMVGVFVYAPARENEAFALLTQVVFIPAVVLTGWMWQQARNRRPYGRPRRRFGRGAQMVRNQQEEVHPWVRTSLDLTQLRSIETRHL